MEIKQLHYFSAIVNNNFNLSVAAKVVYVSQPTLSVFINNFEKKEKVKLFKRKNGRLVGLTDKGNQYYEDAQEVLRLYDLMRNNLHQQVGEIKGEIKIGIPQLINTLVFSEALPKAIMENDNIIFDVYEEGAYTLSSKLLAKEIDIAILLHPEPISSEFIESYTISESELAIAVSPRHKFADRETIDWQDIHAEDMALFDKTFMVNRLFSRGMAFYKVNPNIVFQSNSWDYLLETVINHDNLLTILPYTMGDLMKGKDVKLVKMKSPLPWIVTICRLRKDNYTKTENFVLEYFLRYFRGEMINE